MDPYLEQVDEYWYTTLNGVLTGTGGFSPATSKQLVVLSDGTSPILKEPTSHYFIKYEERLPYGTMSNYDDWSSGYLTTFHGCQSGRISNAPVSYPSNSGPTAAYNAAVEKMVEKIKASDLNLSVDALEGRETVRMFRNALSALRGVKRFVRKAISDTKRDPTLTASNAWLQYKYGWKPLMGTIHGALMFQNEHWDAFRVAARGKASHNSELLYNSGNKNYPRHTVYHSGSYREQIELWYMVTDRAEFSIERMMSLDPTAVAWELVPYSFVVDWFYDVGGYLEALELVHSDNLKFITGYRTSTSLETSANTMTGRFNAYGGDWNEWDCAGWKSKKVKNRQILYEFPVPHPPVLNVNLGSSQYFTAAALLRQLFS